MFIPNIKINVPDDEGSRVLTKMSNRNGYSDTPMNIFKLGHLELFIFTLVLRHNEDFKKIYEIRNILGSQVKKYNLL